MDLPLLPIAAILLVWSGHIAVLSVLFRYDENAKGRWSYLLLMLFFFVGSLIGLAVVLIPLGIVGAIVWGTTLWGLSFLGQLPDYVWKRSIPFRRHRDLGHYQRVLQQIHELRQALPRQESYPPSFKVDALPYELFMLGGERCPRFFLLNGGRPPQSWRIRHNGWVYLLDPHGRLAIRLTIADTPLDWMIERVPDGRSPESFTFELDSEEKTSWRYELRQVEDLSNGYFLTSYETIDPLDGSRCSPPPGRA